MTKQKGTLLIVDDEVHIVNISKLTLEGKVENILTAYNGQEAFDIIKENQVDCVLSDIKMPVMDGIALIKEVRNLGNQVPFIFYTGFGNDALMREALKYGAYDFIDKPEMENLEEVVLRGLKLGTGELDEEGSEEGFVSNFRKLAENEKED